MPGAGADWVIAFKPDPGVAFLLFCGLLRLVMLFHSTGPPVSMLFKAGDELACKLEIGE